MSLLCLATQLFPIRGLKSKTTEFKTVEKIYTSTIRIILYLVIVYFFLFGEACPRSIMGKLKFF